MEILVTIFSSIASAVLGSIIVILYKDNKRLREDRKEENAMREKGIENGVVCLLRVKLIEYHDKYLENQNIPSYAYENFMMMYEAYKQLGGNGMIEHMKDEIQELNLKN